MGGSVAVTLARPLHVSKVGESKKKGKTKQATLISRGGAEHFYLGGPLEGPVLQQGELSMVCVGLSERDLKNFGGATGGARQNFRGAVAPLGTSLAPLLLISDFHAHGSKISLWPIRLVRS